MWRSGGAWRSICCLVQFYECGPRFGFWIWRVQINCFGFGLCFWLWSWRVLGPQRWWLRSHLVSLFLLLFAFLWAFYIRFFSILGNTNHRDVVTWVTIDNLRGILFVLQVWNWPAPYVPQVVLSTQLSEGQHGRSVTQNYHFDSDPQLPYRNLRLVFANYYSIGRLKRDWSDQLAQGSSF